MHTLSPVISFCVGAAENTAAYDIILFYTDRISVPASVAEQACGGGGTFTAKAERAVGKGDGGWNGWCGWVFGWLGREKGIGVGGSGNGNGGNDGGRREVC